MTIHFTSTKHREVYLKLLDRLNLKPGTDPERESCLYLLALIEAQSKHSASNYYDSTDDKIIPESIHRAELTGNTRRLLTAAYILYNGFPVDEGEPEHRLDECFGYSETADKAIAEALKIRYRFKFFSESEGI